MIEGSLAGEPAVAPESVSLERIEEGDVPSPATENSSVGALDYVTDDYLAEETGTIRLPADKHNADRTVPGVCSICLCPYECGDDMTWSTGRSSCSHAL